MPPNPAVPIGNAPYALEGRIVTMDASDTVLDAGRIYVDGGRLLGVTPAGAPPPAGHENDPVLKTAGTIYPGLIELHNHLSYNALTLWAVPKKYTNRDQWAGIPEYRKLISGPMTVLGKTPGCVEAIVRYVECKCLLGGTTTSQGIRLFSNAGITHFYRGVVRNAEQPDDDDLPAAEARIPDVEASDSGKFLAHLKRASCLLLHLSEGTDAAARQHFLALQAAGQEWAITPALAGIHCVALQPADYAVLQHSGGSMIWSPLSNLLLYGATANVAAAKAEGLCIGIGSDWSSSGSKNLLGELKVARLASAAAGNVFGDREIVAMATRNAAAILKWDKAIGSIEAGKHADLLVVAGKAGDPYAHLIEARETDIKLVVIGGVPRYGTRLSMQRFGPGTETWKVGSATRLLNLAQADADPVVGALGLGAARDRLADAMQKLPELAFKLEQPHAADIGLDPAVPRWFLVLDHDEPPGIALRPHLPFHGAATAATPMPQMAAAPLSTILAPLILDPLTVADDATFLNALAKQPNLPDAIKTGLQESF